MRGTIQGAPLLPENPLGPEEYCCIRCGLIGRSRRTRLYDEQGRRKPKACVDCYPWVLADEKARRRQAAS